ncbi:MAG: hypothetical protein O2912_07230 [Proteobacteria bacterium]|nr:hypothetical protein [Pseudomonadota bacterium]
MGLGHGLGPASSEIRMPDIPAVMTTLVDDEKDIDDVLYESAAGPITIRDVVYGYAKQIGFSNVSLKKRNSGMRLSLCGANTGSPLGNSGLSLQGLQHPFSA